MATPSINRSPNPENQNHFLNLESGIWPPLTDEGILLGKITRIISSTGPEDEIWKLFDETPQDRISGIIRDKLPLLKEGSDSDQKLIQKKVNVLCAIFLAKIDQQQSIEKKINYLGSQLSRAGLRFPNQEGVNWAAQLAVRSNNIKFIEFLLKSTPHPFFPRLHLKGVERICPIAQKQNKHDIEKVLEAFIKKCKPDRNDIIAGFMGKLIAENGRSRGLCSLPGGFAPGEPSNSAPSTWSFFPVMINRKTSKYWAAQWGIPSEKILEAASKNWDSGPWGVSR